MMVLIREHKNGSMNILQVPVSMTASEFVEKWSKQSIHYQVRGTLPPITWKVSESTNIVDALIESSKL